MSEPGQYDPEEMWESFWKEICTNPDGSLNVDQIKKELSDFSFMIGEVPKVYCEITGHKISKPMYSAATVLSAHKDHLEDIAESTKKDDIEDGLCSFCGSEL